jgi:hypothetical protein
VGLFWYNVTYNDQSKNSRIINIYGLDKSIDMDDDNQCAISVIQLRRDSFDVDTCFARIHEVRKEYSENEGKNDWRFTVSAVSEKLEIHKSRKLIEGSIFEKLFFISNDQFKTMEEKMKNNGCDNVYALEVEVINGISREIFQLTDTRTCSRVYVEFMDDLITAFEEEMK